MKRWFKCWDCGVMLDVPMRWEEAGKILANQEIHEYRLKQCCACKQWNVIDLGFLLGARPAANMERDAVYVEEKDKK